MSALSGACIAQAESAGKLILFGEHSVVYGERAIAVPLARGLTARAHLQREGAPAELLIPSLGLRLSEPPDQGAPAVIERLWSVWSICWRFAEECRARRGLTALDRPSVCVSVDGPLPFKVGLGSSAALGLALLEVCGRCLEVSLSQQELSEGAWLTEEVFHDQPSGLDHTVALSPSGLSFQRAEGRLDMAPLAIGGPLHLTVCWTPRRGGTADAVRAVRELLAQAPARHELIKRLGVISQTAERHLASVASRARLSALAQLIDEAHEALSDLGVSTRPIEGLRAELKARGALGAKLTGAGFGGAVFGLFSSKEEAESTAVALDGLWITLGER